MGSGESSGLGASGSRLVGVRADRLRRPRLTSTLETFGASVIVISAGAGFGKTTVVANWLEETGRPFGWLSLEEADDDVHVFFGRVAEAVKAICGSGRLEGLVSASSGLGAGERLFASAVVEDLGAAEEGSVFVLEDLHRVSDPSIYLGLQYVLDHLPDSITLVLTTRSDPPLSLARLRTAGRLGEVRTADVAFDADESRQLLESVVGRSIPADVVPRLNERIEGWPAGLQLAGLSMVGRADVEAFVESFSGDDRYVADYLLEEVLDREEAPVQRFLLETSMVDELSGGLCDAIVGSSGSGAVLEDLCRRNVFLMPVDEAGSSYVYHHLFADLLRARLHRRAPDRADEVLRTAAAWCEASGDLDSALRYLVRAGDHQQAATIVTRESPRLMMGGEVGRHQSWLALFPHHHLESDPGLLLRRAWSKLFADRPREALRDLARLEHLGGDDFIAPIEGQLALMRTIAAWFEGQQIECIEHSLRTLERLTETDLGSRCLAHLYRGIAELVVGDTTDALDELVTARALAQRVGNVYPALSAQVAIGAVAIRSGDLTHARNHFQSALDLAEDVTKGGRDFPISGSGDLGLGVVAFERMELEAAAEAFRRAVFNLRKTIAIDYIALAYRRWAETESLQGNHREAREVLDEGRGYLDEFGGNRSVTQGLDACEIRSLLRQGNVHEADRLRRKDAPTPQRGPREFDHPEFEAQVTALRVELALDHVDAAARRLEMVRRLCGDRAGERIEVHVLEAGLRLALDNNRGAEQALTQAIELATPGWWVRLLADTAPAVADLLRSLDPSPETVDLRVRALDARSGSKGQAEPRQPLVDPLTARELEVLTEIAAGHTNAEIAERLYISVGTTKRHVANIFIKLPARHRAEAIAQARRLGILP